MVKRLTDYAPESNTLERYYERGVSSLDITALALCEYSGKNCDDIENSIVITRLVDFT